MDPVVEQRLDQRIEAIRRKKVVERLPLPTLTVRRLVREAAGLSYADMGALFGLTKQAVRLWEHGQAEPEGERRILYRDILLKLAKDVVMADLDRLGFGR